MTDTTKLARTVLALLYSEGGTLAITNIASICATSEEEIVQVAAELRARLDQTGLTIITTPYEVSLVADIEESVFLRDHYARGHDDDIGEAGLEVLATILYKDGVTKQEIDYIRGVNTATTLRNLQARGLIERRTAGQRSYTYHATTETLAHLGVHTPEELPEYATIVSMLAQHTAQAHGHDVSTPAAE